MVSTIQNMYQFKRGEFSAYNGLTTKNADTLYFLTDTKQIYLGEDLFTGVLETTKPATGVVGKIYYVDNKVSYWNGTKYVDIAQDPTSIDEKIANLKGKPTDEEINDGASQDYATLWDVEKAVKEVAADLADKNVDADGDDYVDATAADNKVTVAATDKTKNAIAAAETSIQSLTVNGVNASVSGNVNAKSATVEIKAADIEYKAETSEGAGDAVSVKSALDIINGTGEGSIKKAAADAVATVVDSAPEAFDTLKEVAEWIAAEESAAEAADLVTRMGAAEAAIGRHTVEINGENKEVLYPVTDQISAAKSELKGDATANGNTLGKLEDRLETIEGEDEGSIKKALADAKDYTDDVIDALAGEKTGTNKGVSVKVNTLKGEVSGVEVTVDGTLVNALEVNGKAATVANNKATVEIKAGDIEYKAAEGTEGEADYKAAVSVSGAIAALEDLMGSDSVDDQIKGAIEALDVDSVTVAAEAEGVVTLTKAVKEVDGKISAVDGTDSTIVLKKVATSGEAEDVKLTGYAKGSAIAIAADDDTVLSALGKLEARLCWQSI